LDRFFGRVRIGRSELCGNLLGSEKSTSMDWTVGANKMVVKASEVEKIMAEVYQIGVWNESVTAFGLEVGKKVNCGRVRKVAERGTQLLELRRTKGAEAYRNLVCTFARFLPDRGKRRGSSGLGVPWVLFYAEK